MCSGWRGESEGGVWRGDRSAETIGEGGEKCPVKLKKYEET